MKEPAVNGLALHKTHCARVAVGQNRLRVVGGDLFKLRGDRVQGFVPRDALENPTALFARALHRVEHALRAVGPLQIAVDLRAEKAVSGWVVFRPFDLDRAPVLDGDEERTGVGAIVRARAANDSGTFYGFAVGIV